MAAVHCLDRWKTITDYFRFLHDISVQNVYITKKQDFFLTYCELQACCACHRLEALCNGIGGGGGLGRTAIDEKLNIRRQETKISCDQLQETITVEQWLTSGFK